MRPAASLDSATPAFFPLGQIVRIPIGAQRYVRFFELFDLDLEPGQSIFVPRQAVNRDPARFVEPDMFDVMRTQRRHLSFSHGTHLCLGHAVARTNLQEGLRAFLERCEDITLTEEPVRVPFVPDEQLKSLRVRFRPNAKLM